MIAFICALPREARPLSNLSIVQAGQARLFCSGIGPLNAGRATRTLLGKSKPALVISTGVAGALSPNLKIGDVIAAHEVVDEATAERFPCGPPSAIGDRRSAILSVSRMITSVEEKQSLREKFSADAVDMESAAIARVCAEQAVAFAAIRAISDTADEALPEALTRFFDVEGRFRLFGSIIEALRDPASVTTLKRLQAQTATAMRSLTRFLGENLEVLQRNKS